MNGEEKGRRKRNRSRLATQIRISYLVLLLPNIVFMAFAFYNLYQISARYNDMLNSVVVASEFSLDFKEDFDYETYLLIVGNVSPEKSRIPELFSDARSVVEELKLVTDTEGNKKRLKILLTRPLLKNNKILFSKTIIINHVNIQIDI